MGSRFKRLSEKYLSNVNHIYREQNIGFEPSWFSIFYLLDRYGEITITDISNQLDLTQSAISQMVSILEAKGYVKVEVYKRDKRVRVVSFTESGRELLLSVKPVWKLIKSKMREMLNEGESSKYLLDALEELETSFERKSLEERVLESLRESGHYFVKYRGIYYLSLKKLVFDWMFSLGAPYIDFVNDFKKIVDRNSERIFLAVKDREVISAVFGFEKRKGEFDCLVCDREDVDSKITFSLMSRFFEASKKPKKVYFDADKPLIESFLIKSGYQRFRLIKRDDVDKKLAVFKVP